MGIILAEKDKIGNEIGRQHVKIGSDLLIGLSGIILGIGAGWLRDRDIGNVEYLINAIYLANSVSLAAFGTTFARLEFWNGITEVEK